MSTTCCFRSLTRLLITPPPASARYLHSSSSRQLSAMSVYRTSRVLLGTGIRRLGFRSMATEGIPDVAGVPRSVPVRVAHELLQAGHRYLDVRTPEEFNGGHAAGSVNIPYMFKVSSGMTKNPKFLEEVSSIFGKDDEIIVGCQSGKRSSMAATDLSSVGYTSITDIAGGYLAWIQNSLPTE